MICDIRCNYIMWVDKKYEFCNCTLIIKFMKDLISLNINNLYKLSHSRWS